MRLNPFTVAWVNSCFKSFEYAGVPGYTGATGKCKRQKISDLDLKFKNIPENVNTEQSMEEAHI